MVLYMNSSNGLADSIKDSDKGESITMCKFIDRLRNEGAEKAKVELLSDLVKDGILTIQQAAEKMGMTVSNFQAAAKKLAEN